MGWSGARATCLFVCHTNYCWKAAVVVAVGASRCLTLPAGFLTLWRRYFLSILLLKLAFVSHGDSELEPVLSSLSSFLELSPSGVPSPLRGTVVRC